MEFPKKKETLPSQNTQRKIDPKTITVPTSILIKPSPPPISPAEPIATSISDEIGDIPITNAEFLAAVFNKTLPAGAHAAVCSKSGDPDTGGWTANRAGSIVAQSAADRNNYLNCSSFYLGKDGSFRAIKDRFAACHFLMLDDIGAKVPPARLAGFELSWLIETSPGNHQGGIILARPLTDGAAAVRLLNAVIESGLCDAGATGPLTRWGRFPVGINGKPKYVTKAGKPFRCKLVKWQPD